MEVLVNWFTNTLGQHISREMVIFIISMIPILELRGGLLAASLLNISMVKAIPICILGNIIPIPYSVVYQTNLQMAQKNKNFPWTYYKNGKPCNGQE